MAAIESGKKFSWTAKLVENLIKSLSDFKTRMEFMNKYFNGDKPRQYEEIRKEMALYCSIDIKMFRPEQGRRKHFEAAGAATRKGHIFNDQY